VKAGPMTVLIVVLLLTGASLLIAEAHLASYGILGVTGIALLATGGVLAVGAAGGSVLAAMALVVPVALLMTGLVAVATRKALAVSRRRPRGGADGLIGRIGTVRRDVGPVVGDVFVDGELWRAQRSWLDEDAVLAEGERVVVERVHGLTLSVRRAEEWEVLP
jgi:membrane-bound ClpP family serine protease